MTTTASQARTVSTSTLNRGWRLGKRWRQAVLVVHIVAAGTWIGLDVAMAALVFEALSTSDPLTKGYTYQALELFAVWPLFASGAVCLVSGLLLGLGTSYGLVRYWWVALKLVLNIVLTVLVLLALRPMVIDLAESGRAATAGLPASFLEGDIIFPPIVSPIALLLATWLAVAKPWGRIRLRWPGRA